MQRLDLEFRDQSAGPRELLGLLQHGVVAKHLILVSFPARNAQARFNDLDDPLLVSRSAATTAVILPLNCRYWQALGRANCVILVYTIEK